MQPLGTTAPDGGTVEGRLLGGNLSLLAHLAGTPYGFDLRGAIAVIEDVDERPYAVDRMLTRLALVRAWSGCRAVIAGDFVRCDGRAGVFDVIAERLDRFALPGARGLAIGHGSRNMSLSIGARAVFDPPRGTLEVLDSAVA